MSWWTDARDEVESAISAVSPIDIRSDRARREKGGITGLANKARDWETDVVHNVTGIPTADARRNQAREIADQIQAYKNQTELSRQELATKKNEEIAEKRRIEEKQIRSLRRNYRAQSLLGTQDTNQPDMSSKLGG